tara:strand:- start:110 stop:355 length:246 start_codon:yes stop_codon:yes gene_type:complete
LILKIFWPKRSDAKGFSTQSIASKSREKISGLYSDRNSNNSRDDRDFKSIKENKKFIAISPLPIKKTHWANRDFSEYKNVA